ncbi:O-antigen ligase family protein [Cohnella sp. JJ-181]|uniref:O-antigen ligase family protein n=1 Tax=Cohnella rhizoplanae TaxID=2974897 RepID=UPI00232BC847|nr:O-antigen ligase family protein [Cohnella sp. JJ-181]
MSKPANARVIDTGTIVLLLFLFAGPLIRGFMFESELAGAAIIVLLGFLVFLFRGNLPRDMMLLILLALTALYAASVWYGTDRYESLLGLLKISLLAPLYLFARAASPAIMARIWAAWTWLLGLSVPIAVATDRFVDGRLAGFIDYANGYAILLLLGILIAYGLMASFSSSSGGRLLQIPILLCAGGLYLTESRTVMILLFASFAVMFFLGWRSHRMIGLRASAAATLGLIAGAMYGWSPFLAISIAAIFVLLYRVPDAAMSNRAVRMSLLALSPFAAAAVLWFGSGMTERWSTVASRTGEGATRLVYYRDAWSMFTESPVWGFGAGAWTYMQYHYQSAAYFTAFIHSEPLQIMTETGLIGLLLFAAACMALIGRCISYAKRKEGDASLFYAVRGLACCILLAHSLVDFSLSFPYLLGMLFILGATPASEVTATGAVPVQSATMRITIKSLAAATAACLLAVATLLFVSDQLQQAAVRAIAEQRKADAARLLDRSAEAAIFADRVHDRKARLYLSEFESNGDRRYLDVARVENEKSIKLHPEQIWYQKLNSDIRWEQGDDQTSLDLLRDLVSRNRFMVRWREELAQRASANGSPAQRS